MKKILLLLIIFLIVPQLFAKDVKGKLHTINGHQVLVLEGTHEERGFAYGRLMATEIADTFENYLYKDAAQGSPLLYSIAIGIVKTNLKFEEKYYNEAKGLIAGIKASGKMHLFSKVLNRDLNIDDIFLINSIVDVVGSQKCSSISSWGDATKDDKELNGKLVFTRLLDWDNTPTIRNNALMIVNKPSEPDEQNWISFTFTGMFSALSGINQNGVCSMMNMGNINNKKDITNSHSFLLSLRNGLESKDYNKDGQSNGHDVVKAVKDQKSVGAFIAHVTNGYKQEDGAMIIECNNGDGVAVRTIADNTLIKGNNLVATNHFRKLVPPANCLRFDNIKDSLNNSDKITIARSWDLICNAAKLKNNLEAISFIPSKRLIKFSKSSDTKLACEIAPTDFKLDELFNLTSSSVATGNVIAQTSVSVWPNPTTDKVNIAYSAQQNGIVQYQIADRIGNEVLVGKELILGAGRNNIELNVSNFKAGSYYCKLRFLIAGSSFEQTVAFVVNK